MYIAYVYYINIFLFLNLCVMILKMISIGIFMIIYKNISLKITFSVTFEKSAYDIIHE
jgi:hypothetical protein